MPSNEVSPLVIPSSPAQAVGFRASFLRLLPALEKADERRVPITVDVPTVVWRTTRLLPAILALRSRVVTATPRHDMSCFDLLEDCTGALLHAHVAAISPATPTLQDVSELGARVVKARDAMLGQVAYLVHAGVVDPERLGPIRRAAGYKRSSGELLALVGIVRECWHLLDGKLLLTAAQLDDAELLVKRMADAVAERDRLAAQRVEAKLMRQRAFTLFVHTYSQVRRALTYLLWNDPDLLEATCPSLYSGQRGRRGSKAAR
jgi:hypothetical protein